MTKEELEYGAVPQQERIIPEGMSACIMDWKDEPKKTCVVYNKDGVPVFRVRSKSIAYIGNRLWNYFSNITKEEK